MTGGLYAESFVFRQAFYLNHQLIYLYRQTLDRPTKTSLRKIYTENILVLALTHLVLYVPSDWIKIFDASSLQPLLPNSIYD